MAKFISIGSYIVNETDIVSVNKNINKDLISIILDSLAETIVFNGRDYNLDYIWNEIENQLLENNNFVYIEYDNDYKDNKHYNCFVNKNHIKYIKKYTFNGEIIISQKDYIAFNIEKSNLENIK